MPKIILAEQTMRKMKMKEETTIYKLKRMKKLLRLKTKLASGTDNDEDRERYSELVVIF
jgi:hypothetical protein